MNYSIKIAIFVMIFTVSFKTYALGSRAVNSKPNAFYFKVMEEIYILNIIPFLEVIPMPNIFVIEDAGIELNELN